MSAYPLTTKILTTSGWKSYDELTNSDVITVIDFETGDDIKQVNVKQVTTQVCSGEMVTLHNYRYGYNQVVDRSAKIPLKTDLDHYHSRDIPKLTDNTIIVLPLTISAYEYDDVLAKKYNDFDEVLERQEFLATKFVYSKVYTEEYDDKPRLSVYNSADVLSDSITTNSSDELTWSVSCCGGCGAMFKAIDGSVFIGCVL